MMKKTYQQPIMLTVHLRTSHIVCATNTKGNTNIKLTNDNDEGQVIRSCQHSVWDNGEDE
ncbi:MAG: hypothetical protein K5896_13705 [Prevotella sp.]|nr:hypothetical protein [Prevotella sp.]